MSSQVTEEMVQRAWRALFDGNPANVMLSAALVRTAIEAALGVPENLVPPNKPDMRKVAEALGFEPDNHHNAAVCPYCRQGAPGFIIANGNRDKFRCVGEFGNPDWTDERDKALRFARRQDAEEYCREDEDAWAILPVGNPEPRA